MRQSSKQGSQPVAPSSDNAGRLARLSSQVLSSVFVQLLATLFSSLVIAMLNGWIWTEVFSVWVGGTIAIAVIVFGAWRGLWRRSGELDANRLLAQLYSAEFGKLMLAGLLLGIAFKQFAQLSAALIVFGFAATYLVGSVALARFGFVAPDDV